MDSLYPTHDLWICTKPSTCHQPNNKSTSDGTSIAPLPLLACLITCYCITLFFVLQKKRWLIYDGMPLPRGEWCMYSPDQTGTYCRWSKSCTRLKCWMHFASASTGCDTLSACPTGVQIYLGVCVCVFFVFYIYIYIHMYLFIFRGPPPPPQLWFSSWSPFETTTGERRWGTKSHQKTSCQTLKV